MTESALHAVEVVPAGSLTDVDEGEWDSLVGDDEFYASHAWLRSIEQETDMEARYLLARSGDGKSPDFEPISISEALSPSIAVTV